MSDRILVMREGRQAEMFDAHSTSQEQIMSAATEGLRAA
jgi:ABC-type sugar transport system ATPase subunit